MGQSQAIYSPPEPKLQWIWLSCVYPFCGHTRAIPLAPWRVRWGDQDLFQNISRHFKCGSCGRRGCVFYEPRRGTGQNGAAVGIDEPYPWGRELRINGERRWPESYPDAEIRVIAEYRARFPCGDAIRMLDCMCNLYALKSGQKHVADSARAVRDLTGNMPLYPAIFPNRIAPIVRNGIDGQRELLNARWGFPPPSIPGRKLRNPYLTNIRNTDSRYWQTYLKKPEHGCLVSVTSFAEPDNNQGPKSLWTWFAQDDSRPLMFFAGIWREWEGDRGTKAAQCRHSSPVFFPYDRRERGC